MKRIILTALSLIFAVALTSCAHAPANQESKYDALDYEKINTGRTTINMRKVYYKEHVDTLLKNMSEKEQDDYYVTLNIKPISDDLEDHWFSFYRNDNSHTDIKQINDTQFKLPPGVYRMTFSAEDLDEFAVCELVMLTPGSKITLKEESDNTYLVQKGDCEITKHYDIYYEDPTRYDNSIDCDRDFDVEANDIAIDYEFEALNPAKVDTQTTDIEDRSDYYQEHVTRLRDYMDQDEKEHFYIKINMEYKNADDYSYDNFAFIRNDNVYMGDIPLGGESVMLPPGVYRIISAKVEENRGAFGEIAILTPGAEITLVVDYKTQSIRITDGDGKVVETNN